MSGPVVEIRDVAFGYDGEAVIEDVNLEVNRGDFLAMIGPNGGGKTTLLKLMLGLLQPGKGSIRVLGRAPLKAAPHVGYVPQDAHANRSFPITALDVVLMGMPLTRGWWRPTSRSDRREAMEALDRLEVSQLAERRIGVLSGGQRQRVFIARALVSRPELMLLDEPTAGVDTRGQADFFEMLRALNREITIIVVSHDLLAVSRYVKSVACVNRRLHYHNQAEITGEMMGAMYPQAVEAVCPVELVAQRLPGRVSRDQNGS